jgi:hypothetical protein
MPCHPNLGRLDRLTASGWLKFKSKVGWKLLELTRLAQTMLKGGMDLWGIYFALNQRITYNICF